MTHHQQPKRQGCLVVLGIIGLLLLGTYGYHQFRVYRYKTVLYALVERFGYTPAGEIAYSLRCHDFTFLGESNCGPFVIFRTTLTHDDLRMVIENSNFRTDPWDPRVLDPNGLFSDIEYETNKTLSWATTNGAVDTTLLREKIFTVAWEVQDQEGRNIDIDFYETSAISGSLILDGQSLTENIISIEINVGWLPMWLPLL